MNEIERKKVLIAGASGFIGSAIMRHMQLEGLDPVGAKTNVTEVLENPGKFIDGFDVIIWCCGSWRGKDMEVLHVMAPLSLAKSCAATGKHFIMISALGCREEDGGFSGSRARFERAVCDLSHVTVLRPSVVLGKGGESFGLMSACALSPIPFFVKGVDWNPILVDDLALICHKVALQPAPPQTVFIDCVGETSETPVETVTRLRSVAGGKGRCRELPEWFESLCSSIGGFIGGGFDKDTRKLLARSASFDRREGDKILGRAARGSESMMKGGWERDIRASASAYVMGRLSIFTMALIWFVTVISTIMYPAESAKDLLRYSGLPESIVGMALYTSTLLDFAMGILTVIRPSKRLWLSQFALVSSYSIFCLVALPMDIALHPFGPILKNMAVLVLLTILYIEEKND